MLYVYFYFSKRKNLLTVCKYSIESLGHKGSQTKSLINGEKFRLEKPSHS